MIRREQATGQQQKRRYYSCRDVGCKNQSTGKEVTTIFHGEELECTKL
jgi:hypothetical protein